MTARFQQWAIAVALLFAAAGVFIGVRWQGSWWLGALYAFAVLTLPAYLLALEFFFSARSQRLPPTVDQVLIAWWAEVLSVPRVFCWRQPFRSRAEPDHLPAGASRRGVVLVHGFVCNRGIWNGWMSRLRRLGVPYVAIDLEPPFASIDRYAESIGEAVESLRRLSGVAPVVVAHSMGGLAVRHWWCVNGAPAPVRHVITIGTPHQGTSLARFGMTPNAKQMRRSSPWLLCLAAREPPDRAPRFTCFYSNCDNVVFPAEAATLPGASNRAISGAAHVHMLDMPEPFEVLMRELEH